MGLAGFAHDEDAAAIIAGQASVLAAAAQSRRGLMWRINWHG
jgi:hypothetical protein